jgi:hypothetical protein
MSIRYPFFGGKISIYSINQCILVYYRGYLAMRPDNYFKITAIKFVLASIDKIRAKQLIKIDLKKIILNIF